MGGRSSTEGRAIALPATTHGRVALVTAVAAVALIPWTFALANTLPAQYLVVHWNATWIGFDVGLVASLTAAAYTAWRRRSSFRPAAMISATLLMCDAWFDVSTATAGTDVAASLLSAMLVELPLAAALAWAAARLR